MVQTIQFCSNFTSMWSKNLSNNVWRDFYTSNVSISNGNIKCPIGKSIFAVNLLLKLFRAIVANADMYIGSPKSLHTLLDEYWDHILVQFEQNYMIQTTQNVELFDKKRDFYNHFQQRVDAILEDVSAEISV